MLSAIGLVSLRHNKEYESLTEIQKKFYLITGFVPVIIFASSMGTARFDQSIAQFTWMLIIPVQMFFNKKIYGNKRL